MAWFGVNADSCFVKSLWDAVGLNCTAVGKLVYRGTGTSYLVMRLSIVGVITNSILYLGTGFSHRKNTPLRLLLSSNHLRRSCPMMQVNTTGHCRVAAVILAEAVIWLRFWSQPALGSSGCWGGMECWGDVGCWDDVGCWSDVGI